jgi:hypothetical protein
MKSFLVNYNISNIKTKFLLLYFINFTDIIFTLMLLNTGCFIEGNPLLHPVIENTILLFLIKIIIPALLLISIYHRIQDATFEQLKKSNIIILISLSLYTLVNLSHIFWLSFFLLKN